MIVALVLHGALFVGFISLYGRWLDDEVTADVCLFGLLCELFTAVVLVRYTHLLDSFFFLSLGTPSAHPGFFLFELTFCFDEISGYFLAILAFALLVCFFFLIEYFEYDVGASSIVTLSSLFSQAALLYFCSFDICLLLIFWELISIISFLLVQHWAFRVSSYKAGLKVFTVSQFGDLPFFLFIFASLARFQTTCTAEFIMLLPSCLFEYILVGPFCFHYLTGLGLCLQVAIFLKAAQWFFYPWLLDAMEAPVPISAQLHSSTLVVIGFYLFFRFHALFLLTPGTGVVAVCAGFSTSIGASILGFFQEDGKKLLACSTASQLGYVVLALGVGLYPEALYLLCFCCCNKAVTFVWFGVFMRRHSGVSDFRRIAAQGLTWAEHAGLAVAIANFTIFPGAFCWHVKGLINTGVLDSITIWNSLGVSLLQVTWFFSSLYLLNLYFILFFGTPRLNSRLFNLTLAGLSAHSLEAMRLTPQLRVGVPSTFRTRSLLWGAQLVLVWFGGAWGLFFCDTAWMRGLWGLSWGYF